MHSIKEIVQERVFAELPHGKCSVSSDILGATTNEDGEITRLDNVLHTSVPQTNILDQNGDLDSLGRASRNDNLLEALQSAVWNNHGGNLVRNIYLDNLRSLTSLVSVGHSNTHGNTLIGRRDCGAVHGDGPILKSGVTLAVAEWIPRKWVAENILVPKDEGPVTILMARVANRTTRVQIIIEDREVADIPGEADRQLAGGVIVTEQNISKGITAFFRRVELLNQSGSRVRNPGVGNRLAAG